jgi:hypothetical protein
MWYGSRGEPIQYGSHHLRYVVGSRPVRLKCALSSDVVARNDAAQIQFDDLLQLVRKSGRKMAYLDHERRIEDGPSYGAVVIS